MIHACESCHFKDELLELQPVADLAVKFTAASEVTLKSYNDSTDVNHTPSTYVQAVGLAKAINLTLSDTNECVSEPEADRFVDCPKILIVQNAADALAKLVKSDENDH